MRVGATFPGHPRRAVASSRSGAGLLLVALASLLGAVPARGQATPPTIRVADSLTPLESSALAEADSLFDAMDPEGALQRLESRLAVAPGDAEARWRAARAALVLGVMAHGRRARVAWLTVAEAHGDSVLAGHPNDVDALTWAAAAKGRLAISTGGAFDRARMAQEVWDLTARILELDPDNAFGHDIRGKLNQEVQKLGRVARFLARTFVGNAPLKESTWDQAEYHLGAAIAADPDVVLFHLDLAETYLLQGKRELARAEFELALALPDRYPPDPKFKETIRAHLAELAR